MQIQYLDEPFYKDLSKNNIQLSEMELAMVAGGKATERMIAKGMNAMEKMKELYDKVAKDSALQTKFAEIMKDAEKSGKDETGKKLAAFAKEAGYEATVEEMVGFFKSLEVREGTLSEEELDAVAGGKAYPGPASIAMGMSGCQPLVSTPVDQCILYVL